MQLTDSRGLKVELESPVGPRVLVAGSWEREEIERELPAGWTIGGWNEGTRLPDGAMAYRLAQV
jgi:hypothetical protein